jgi:hypothetical protein
LAFGRYLESPQNLKTRRNYLLVGYGSVTKPIDSASRLTPAIACLDIISLLCLPQGAEVCSECIARERATNLQDTNHWPKVPLISLVTKLNSFIKFCRVLLAMDQTRKATSESASLKNGLHL